MTTKEFNQICKLSDKLMKHGVNVSDFVCEVVVPYKSNLWLVRHETTVADIVEGDSVTVHMNQITDIAIAVEDSEDTEDGYDITE